MANVGIGDIFHIIHVSETLEPLDAFYDDVFGPRKHLADKGIGIIGRDEHTILADPQKTFGAPFRFTTWDVPGDPRD